MIGAILGAASAVANGVVGAISAQKARKLKEKYIQSEKDANERWYQRRLNESALDKADAQLGYTRTVQAIKDRNKADRATAAVMGGTGEQLMAGANAGVQALADYQANVVANASGNRDKVEDMYRSQQSSLAEQQMKNESEYQNSIATNMASAASQAVQAGISVENSGKNPYDANKNNPNS